MFLCASKSYVTAIIVAVIVVQYAFALYCLLKLAYLNIDKKKYVLWNIFILLVFFVGGVVFLVYLRKHPELRIDDAPDDQKNSAAERSEQENDTQGAGESGD